MERAERLLALGFGLLFDSLLVPVLWVMLVLTALTAIHRFVLVYRQAGRPPRVHTRRPARNADGSTEPRPAAIRSWWAARRVDSERTRRRHSSARRSSRP
jgi:CDP-diacylglycerol--glycerol-3-phosphate 3-phosphatidyltransferase